MSIIAVKRTVVNTHLRFYATACQKHYKLIRLLLCCIQVFQPVFQWLNTYYNCTLQQRNDTHNHFTALLPGPPGWASARRNLLDIYGATEDNKGRHTDHPAGRHSIRTNQWLPSSPHFYARCPSCNNHPTLSWLADLGQVPNMLACILSGVVYSKQIITTEILKVLGTANISAMPCWNQHSVVTGEQQVHASKLS